MKVWKKRMKLKPRRFFSMVGLVPCRNAKERHEAKLAESIYKKRTFWPDRMTPLTAEEKEFDSRPTGLTLDKMNAHLDEIRIDPPNNNQPVLLSKKRINELERILKLKQGWRDKIPGGVVIKK